MKLPLYSAYNNYPKRKKVKETETNSKCTRLGAITAGIASNPQDVTPSINLHIEFFWRRAQFNFCEIKPTQKIMNPSIED
jgi:hypothetical protein